MPTNQTTAPCQMLYMMVSKFTLHHWLPANIYVHNYKQSAVQLLVEASMLVQVLKWCSIWRTSKDRYAATE